MLVLSFSGCVLLLLEGSVSDWMFRTLRLMILSAMIVGWRTSGIVGIRDWMIRIVESRDKRKNDSSVSLSSRIVFLVMYPHTSHCISFFESSSLFRPVRHVKVNCLTFHLYLHLSASDADLYWALGRCFACEDTGHRSESCQTMFGRVRYTCTLLDDPHSTLFVILGF